MMEIEYLDANKAYTVEECVRILMQSPPATNETRDDTTSESLNCNSQIPPDISNISLDEDQLFSQSRTSDGTINESINQLTEKSSVELNTENDQHDDLFQLQEVFDEALSSTLLENIKDIFQDVKGMLPNSSWIDFNKENYYIYPKNTTPFVPKKDIANCSEEVTEMESKGNEEVEVESNDDEDIVEDEDFVNGEDNDDKDYVPEVDEELDVSGDENIDNEERAMKVKRICTEEDKCI